MDCAGNLSSSGKKSFDLDNNIFVAWLPRVSSELIREEPKKFGTLEKTTYFSRQRRDRIPGTFIDTSPANAYSFFACSAKLQMEKEVDEIYGKKITGRIVNPQDDEIRQMGGLDPPGIHTNLASFDRVVLDGLQGLHHDRSDPVSRSGPKYDRSSAEHVTGFSRPPKRRCDFCGHQKPAGTGDELHLRLVHQRSDHFSHPLAGQSGQPAAGDHLCHPHDGQLFCHQSGQIRQSGQGKRIFNRSPGKAFRLHLRQVVVSIQ